MNAIAEDTQIATWTEDGQVCTLDEGYAIVHGQIVDSDGVTVGDYLIADGRVMTTDGLVLGTAVPSNVAVPAGEPMTEGLAEWVLGKLQGLDARHTVASMAERDAQEALDAMERDAKAKAMATPEAMEQKAILANALNIKERAAHDVDFFVGKYLEDLKAFAERNTKKHDRTWRCPRGAISLRNVAASIAVTKGGQADALTWAKKNAPDAVKTEESVLVSKIGAAAKQTLIADPEAAKTAGFTVSPAKTTVAIQTGIASVRS